MPTTFALQFMDSGTTANTPNIDDFISLENTGGVVTVDTTQYAVTPPIIMPSYRTVETVSCNGVYTSLCSTLTMPIMIHTTSQGPSTTTIKTRNGGTCVSGTEWPKVLSDNLGTNSAFTSMSVDQYQGNVLICGWSKMASHAP